MHNLHFILISSFLFSISIFNVWFVVAGEDSGASPFTPKASLLRYWNRQIRPDLPKSPFLIEKASPLSAVESAKFAKLALDQVSLSRDLQTFCKSAKLLCFPDLSPSLEKHNGNSKFSIYSGKNFTNYGTGNIGMVNSFKNYSDDQNVIADTFRRYSRDSVGNKDKFSNYAHDGNVVDQSFNGYGDGGSTGGAGEFVNYNHGVNVPNLDFTSYSNDGNGRKQTFKQYTETTNSGNERFTSYGKNGNGDPNEFTSYGLSSNVIGSDFNGYGETANGANDTFTSYGEDGNVPENHFKNYGAGGNAGLDSFKGYRDRSNVGDSTFDSYGKNSNHEKTDFANYGQSYNKGSEKFTGYGKSASGQKVGFKGYGVNTTFADYTKQGVTFAQYTNRTTTTTTDSVSVSDSKMKMGGENVNKWVVEPGKFFRESMLKKGTVMPMPDIRDKMPKRSFLPRSIVSKLPFSSSKINELKLIFHAEGNSSMESMLLNGVSECERAPSPGETKRCVGSIEDMLDFATSVLGRSIVVRTTENISGSKKDIMIGAVKGINGGKVTKSVSCHQSLYPYLLYYCHSVPKVHVYEAEIMDPKTKGKINNGIAICHLDTSTWSATHGAFLSLGSRPGKIEVCHWIFENDMTWTIADSD